MKSLLLCSVVLAASVFAHAGLLAHNRANTRADLMEAANRILEEQIVDMSMALVDYKSAKTYEDGVDDGIRLGENAMYTKGYHRGIQHAIDHRNVSEYTLVEGEHASKSVDEQQGH